MNPVAIFVFQQILNDAEFFSFASFRHLSSFGNNNVRKINSDINGSYNALATIFFKTLLDVINNTENFVIILYLNFT